MSKSKTIYFCQNCGYESAKWLGKCPSCNQWNTFAEELVAKNETGKWAPSSKTSKAKPLLLSDVETDKLPRLKTPDEELNRVLGGGIVPGSIVLIGGEPGIGKSTLMLQIALSLENMPIIYVSGEESNSQIKLRADRIMASNDQCYVLAETDVRAIVQEASVLKPAMLIIDSIQTLTHPSLESAPGTISQVRECTGDLLRFAKESHTPVFLVGHITKDGSLAGPKVLEHMVDTVLHFEGERHLNYRMLRTVKNRFGSTAELGIYEMRNSGLRQVSNPSEILLSQRETILSGVAIGASLEGNRPLLIEIQSLVSPTSYGMPQRSGTGFDMRRLQMLLAVLEKRGGFRFGNQDVFLNLAGGFKIEDPALDLAVCMAMVSSIEGKPIPDKICFAGEVGLGGEIRTVNRVENRIAEASRLGFEKILVSRYYQAQMDLKKLDIEVIKIGNLDDALIKVYAAG